MEICINKRYKDKDEDKNPSLKKIHGTRKFFPDLNLQDRKKRGKEAVKKDHCSVNSFS